MSHISSKGPNFAAFKNVSNGVVSFELGTYSIIIYDYRRRFRKKKIGEGYIDGEEKGGGAKILCMFLLLLFLFFSTDLQLCFDHIFFFF